MKKVLPAALILLGVAYAQTSETSCTLNIFKSVGFEDDRWGPYTVDSGRVSWRDQSSRNNLASSLKLSGDYPCCKAALYENADFSLTGTEVQLGVGEYSFLEVDTGFPNNELSAFEVLHDGTCSSICKLNIFESVDFKDDRWGPYTTDAGQGQNSWTWDGKSSRNNKASAAKLYGDSACCFATLYENADFSGESVRFGVGEYAYLYADLDFPNNALSAFVVENVCGAPAEAAVADVGYGVGVVAPVAPVAPHADHADTGGFDLNNFSWYSYINSADALLVLLVALLVVNLAIFVVECRRTRAAPSKVVGFRRVAGTDEDSELMA